MYLNLLLFTCDPEIQQTTNKMNGTQMQEFCPVCLFKGHQTKLMCFNLNHSETAILCTDAKCPYPFGLVYTDTFMKQDMVKDGDIKLDMKSLPRPVTFPSSRQMNIPKADSVVDSFNEANLPSTSLPLPNEEHLSTHNLSDIVDFYDFDAFSTMNENIKDLDYDLDPEFESFFKICGEESIAGDSQHVLPTDNDLKKLNTGSSTDSLPSQSQNVRVKGTNNIVPEDQVNIQFSEIGENEDRSLVTAELCRSGFLNICSERPETTTYTGNTKPVITMANTDEVAPISKLELAFTSLCNESKQSITTVARRPLLNAPALPATNTTQAVQIPCHIVDFNRVVTNDSAVQYDLETSVDREVMEKNKIEVSKSLNLKNSNSVLPEKSLELLCHAEISHSMGNDCNIATEKRTGDVTPEVGMPVMTACTVRGMLDHSYSKVSMEDTISTSRGKLFELLNHTETSHSLTDGDDIVTAGIGTPVAIPYIAREVLDHSYSRVSAVTEQLNAKTSHSAFAENAVPGEIDVRDLNQSPLGTKVKDLASEVLNLALSDIPVAENVTVASCGVEGIPYGTKVEGSAIRGLNLQSICSTAAENWFLAKNNVTSMSQMNFMRNTGFEETIPDLNQTLLRGVTRKSEKLSVEERPLIMTNCDRLLTQGTNCDRLLMQGTISADCDVDILKSLPLTTEVRQVAIGRRNSGGVDHSQLAAVSLELEQMEGGSRTDSGKNEPCLWGRSKSVGKKIENDLKLDGLQNSSIVKGKVNFTNSERNNGAEFKNAFVVDSKMKQITAPEIVNIRQNSNLIVVKCKGNMPLPDLSKLGKNIVSVMCVKPQILPKNIHQQSNSTEPSGVVTQKAAESNTTETGTKQNKGNEISAMLPGSTSRLVANGKKLCINRQKKTPGTGKNIDNIRSDIKSCIAFAGNMNKDKFAGFTFEEPLVPQANRKTCSVRKPRLKARKGSKRTKRQVGQDKALRTQPPYLDPSIPITPGNDFSNRVTVSENLCSNEDCRVENVGENLSTDENVDWIKQLLMSQPETSASVGRM